MNTDFKAQNIKTILITEPFILKTSQNFEESSHLHGTDNLGRPYLIKDFYFGEAGLIDIFRQDARNWFWQKHEKQNKIGVAAWWGDLGEPEKHPKDLYHNLRDLGHNRLFSSDEVHNIYGHLWTKMLYENYEKHYPDTRLFSLNRSGFAGSQRYSIFPWSGDVHRSWSGLRAQLPVMLGMSLSGIPYMHSDAGGFAMGDGDHDLYIRWLQMSVFTPVLRPHGSALGEMDKNSFSFPSEPVLMPEPFMTRAREAVQLRYKLLPYNYTLAYEHTSTGRPLAVPLFFDYPEDNRVHSLEKSYLWGSQILVAPILEKGISEMKIILPEGKWYYVDLLHKNQLGWFTSEAHIKTTPHHIPVFVKEGSFIPMCDQDGMTSEDFTTDSLWVQYYLSDEPSNYTLFDDDGHNKNSITLNEYELITFTARPGKKSMIITIQSNGGSFPTQPEDRHLTLQILGDKTFKSAVIKIKNRKIKVPLDKNQILHIPVRTFPVYITLKS
jgi:oligosaccharide 4-alpha-D-glucosyltransferase